MPEDGISIILHGKLTVYDQQGIYQIVGTRVEPLGLGALQLAFEQLKQRLAAEGLFDEAHKKPIPPVPRRIGIITSLTGAAIRDMLNIISRRFSNVSILIHPVAVQGEGAAEEIAAAIDTMNKIGDLDVLIVGRGGGSLEDLWAFNEEIVARSIYASKIPVISAVGHEIDFTIADFVADLRAPTPSAAAEMVVPNKIDLAKSLESIKARLYGSMSSQMQLLRGRSKNIQHRLLLKDVRDKVHLLQQHIDDLREKLLYIGVPAQISQMRRNISNLEQECITSIQHLVKSRGDEFRITLAKLNALSPLSILQRGYSICFQYPSKKVIKSADEVSAGDKIGVKLGKGEMICEVKQALS